MHACALVGNFFSGYYQKMRKVKFYKLLGSRFEKQVLKYEKSDKQTFEISFRLKKRSKLFSSCNQTMRNESYLRWSKSHLKHKCQKNETT